MINQYLLLLYQGSRCVYIHLTVQSTCIQQLNCVGITEETMAAVVYCHGIIYTLLLQSSWTVTKPAVFDEVFLPYNSILRPNRHFKVSSCSSSQLQFAYTVDLFQNMLKCKHLDSELLDFFFSLDDNQNKTNEKKEKKMVSQKPHGTIEYTVSTGVFMPAFWKWSCWGWEGGSGTKL